MPRLLTSLCTLRAVVTLLPDIAVAQDEEPQGPPVIFMTSWMCDRGDALTSILEGAQNQELPIYQDLVNEGKLLSASTMVHDWGDEWNYVTITVASDMEAGLAASDEAGERYEELYGDDEDLLTQHCRSHRDNIYVGDFGTNDPEGITYETPYTVAMSYFACPFDVLGDISEDFREVYLPAAQASVDAEMGYWTGGMRHAWADEWTYVLGRAAKDLPSILTFADDIDERIMAGNPPEGGPATDACAHKDNIYTVVAETTPRSE